MQEIKYREQKMQEKRKDTSFRDFIKEIASWGALSLYNYKGMISIYPDTDRIPQNLVSMDKYLENIDTLTNLGVDYTGDFFEDFYRLKNTTLIPSLRNLYAENSEYCANVRYAKNSYLSFSIVNAENALYSFHVKENVTNILNSTTVWDNCANIYSSHSILRSQNIFYSKNITDGYENWFCSNLQGCQHCLFCDDMQNQSYCIKNKKYTKEEYLLEKNKILSQKERFSSRSEDVYKNGKYFEIQSENIINGRNTYRIKNARNVINTGSINGNKNFCDMVMGGSPSGTDLYANIYVGPGEHIYCSDYIAGDQHIYYSYFMDSCSYCLGCIGLKNKSFCILNKQYTKEERLKLVNQIFTQMDKDGILGRFFPGKYNPYYFNDTVAYLIDDSFTKEEVEVEGYLRRDEEIKVDIPEGAEMVKSTELDQYQGFDDNGERKINSEILKKVIVDEKGNYYRVVKMEYDFLMKHGLPLPEIHWLDRIKLGFKF